MGLYFPLFPTEQLLYVFIRCKINHNKIGANVQINNKSKTNQNICKIGRLQKKGLIYIKTNFISNFRIMNLAVRAQMKQIRAYIIVETYLHGGITEGLSVFGT